MQVGSTTGIANGCGYLQTGIIKVGWKLIKDAPSSFDLCLPLKQRDILIVVRSFRHILIPERWKGWPLLRTAQAKH
jgi:hypothetical protein